MHCCICASMSTHANMTHTKKNVLLDLHIMIDQQKLNQYTSSSNRISCCYPFKSSAVYQSATHIIQQPTDAQGATTSPRISKPLPGVESSNKAWRGTGQRVAAINHKKHTQYSTNHQLEQLGLLLTELICSQWSSFHQPAFISHNSPPLDMIHHSPLSIICRQHPLIAQWFTTIIHHVSTTIHYELAMNRPLLPPVPKLRWVSRHRTAP